MLTGGSGEQDLQGEGGGAATLGHDVEGWPIDYPCDECGAEAGEECRPYCIGYDEERARVQAAENAGEPAVTVSLLHRPPGDATRADQGDGINTATGYHAGRTPAVYEPGAEVEAASNISRPTLGEILGTLDELAAAVRVDDLTRYSAALRVAREQRLTNEQIIDAYRWGIHGRREGGSDQGRQIVDPFAGE